MNHYCLVEVKGDDEKIRITIRCRQCGVTELPPMAPAHLATLARACAGVAKAAGLDVGMAAEITNDPQLRGVAEDILKEYQRRREGQGG